MARTCKHVRPLQVPRTTPRSMLMIMVSLAGMMKSRLFHVRLTYGQSHETGYYGLQCRCSQGLGARRGLAAAGVAGVTRDKEEVQGAYKDQTGDISAIDCCVVLVHDLQ